jgi:short-subunit dehydrogenase
MTVRDLSGKRVVLTGATSGIGWSLATALIGAGASVVVSGRREERLKRLKLSLGNCQHLICVPGDLCEHPHRNELIQTSVDRLGGLDILINNAGVGAVGAFELAEPQRLRQVFELDFFAAVELTRLAIPYLKQGRTPAICNINSVLGHRAVPFKSEYCAAKFALRGWSESLRVELKSSGIDVLNVSPSTTRSEFFQSLLEGNKRTHALHLGAQTADKVARSTVRSLQRGRRESILSMGGKAMLWFSGKCPKLTDLVLQKLAMA